MVALQGGAIWRTVFCEVVPVRLGPREQDVWIGWGYREWWKSESTESQAWTLFDSKTGFQVFESNWYHDPGEKKLTIWDADGTVIRQVDGYRRRVSPPWLWGKTDQLAPSAPWLRLGIDSDEWVERTFGG